MMARDPARRYQTPAEAAAALHPFLTRPRRRWWLWSAAAAVLLLLGALVTVWVTRGPTPKAEVIRRIDPHEKLISQDISSNDGQGWRIEAKEPQTVRLTEVPVADVEDCRLIYRARMKTENLQGQAYLEMWCRLPEGGESFSRGLMNPVSGTTDWASYETPFFLERGERPDLIKLNVVIEGTGTLWIRDITLQKAPR